MIEWIIVIAIMAILAILLGVAVNGAYQQNVWGYQYQNDVQQYFEKADRSATLKDKAQAFDQYVVALEKENLTQGKSTMWPWPHATSDLGYNFQIVKTLQTRLHEVQNIDPNSYAYADQNRQIIQEFCWFPNEPFEYAYLMHHGIWVYGEAWQQIDKCAPVKSSS